MRHLRSLILAVVLVCTFTMGAMAQGENFMVYHRNKNKVSMADQAFVKEPGSVKATGDADFPYELELITQKAIKNVGGIDYKADPIQLEILSGLDGKVIATATAVGERESSVTEGATVPAKFVVKVPKEALKGPIAPGSLEAFSEHIFIKFDTNLRENESVWAQIGAKMMNPQARFAFEE